MDVRYALRVLWKSPAFTLVALVTLMLGIGANIVVFGVVNAVLLKPLDVSDPQNLYQLRLGPWTNWKLLTTSYPAFEDYPAAEHHLQRDRGLQWILSGETALGQLREECLRLRSHRQLFRNARRATRAGSVDPNDGRAWSEFSALCGLKR